MPPLITGPLTAVPRSMCAMTERSYYFWIPSAHVRECVRAEDFQQAKAIAFDGWLEWWDEIKWLNPDETNHLIVNG